MNFCPSTGLVQMLASLGIMTLAFATIATAPLPKRKCA